jgi:hypothetical protein
MLRVGQLTTAHSAERQLPCPEQQGSVQVNYQGGEMDWFLAAGIVCLAVGGLALLAKVGFDMMFVYNDGKREKAGLRAWYQTEIRRVITELSEEGVGGPWSPKDIMRFEDLEWQLHSLLYEYRNGILAVQGGSYFYREVDRSMRHGS